MIARAVYPLEFLELKELPANTSEESAVEPERIDQQTGAADVLAQLEDRLRSQTERSERQIEMACEQTRAEVREQLAQEFEEKVALEREAVARICDRFAKERARYFLEVEAEVVRLALAIAARVLHREAALDPFLLRGVVRVALERIQEDSVVTLRVPDNRAGGWKEILAGEHRRGVTVVGDGRLGEGECVLETSVGRVELGVAPQLEEIEKGFFDLLHQRPA